MTRFNDILTTIAYFCHDHKIDVNDATSLAFDVLGEAGQLQTYEDDERNAVERGVQEAYSRSLKHPRP